MILANCLLTTMFFMQAPVKTSPKSVFMACNLHNVLSLSFFFILRDCARQCVRTSEGGLKHLVKCRLYGLRAMLRLIINYGQVFWNRWPALNHLFVCFFPKQFQAFPVWLCDRTFDCHTEFLGLIQLGLSLQYGPIIYSFLIIG